MNFQVEQESLIRTMLHEINLAMPLQNIPKPRKKNDPNNATIIELLLAISIKTPFNPEKPLS